MATVAETLRLDGELGSQLLARLPHAVALILVVLICEQAMAVRLSYHASPGELDHTAPSAAAAVHRHWGHHAGETPAAS